MLLTSQGRLPGFSKQLKFQYFFRRSRFRFECDFFFLLQNGKKNDINHPGANVSLYILVTLKKKRAGQAYGKTLRWRWFRNRKKGDLEDKKYNSNSQKKKQQAEEAVLYTHMQSEPSGVLIPAQRLLVT